MKTKTVALLGVLGGVVLILVWILVFHKPVSGQVALLQERIDKAEKRADELTAELSRLKRLEEEEPETDAKLATLSEALPNTPDEQAVISQLQAAAFGNDIDLTGITLEQPQSGANVSTITLSVEITGTYSNVAGFLASVLDTREVPRAITFDTVQIASGGDQAEGLLNVSLVGRTFTLEGAGATTEQAAGVAADEKGKTDKKGNK